MRLWELFWSFLQIGLFSFGGGYASMPVIEAQIVQHRAWLTAQEFTDLITISQMTPGPIAVNAATFVGIRLAGIPGAIAATLGCVAAPCAVVLALARLYLRYRRVDAMQNVLQTLRPAVVAMIASSGWSILAGAVWPGGVRLAGTDVWMAGIFTVCLVLLRRTKLSPIAVMALAGAANLAAGWLGGRL